jgi:hypothetical protein
VNVLSSVEITDITPGRLVEGTPDSLAGVLLQAIYETEESFLAGGQVRGLRLMVIFSLIFRELLDGRGFAGDGGALDFEIPVLHDAESPAPV